MTSMIRCSAWIFALIAVGLPLGCGKDEVPVTPRAAATENTGATAETGAAPAASAPGAVSHEPDSTAPSGMRMGSSSGGGNSAAAPKPPVGNGGAAVPATAPAPPPAAAPASGGSASSSSSAGATGGSGLAPTDEAARMASLAAQPKYAQFVATATERHEAMLAAASFRLRTRGRELTEAENAEFKRLGEEVGKAGEKMGAVASRPGWTQDDYLVMDYIVGELIRTRPPGS